MLGCGADMGAYFGVQGWLRTSLGVLSHMGDGYPISERCCQHRLGRYSGRGVGCLQEGQLLHTRMPKRNLINRETQDRAGPGKPAQSQAKLGMQVALELVQRGLALARLPTCGTASAAWSSRFAQSSQPNLSWLSRCYCIFDEADWRGWDIEAE